MNKFPVLLYGLSWKDVLKISITPNFTVMEWLALMHLVITGGTKESVCTTFPTSQHLPFVSAMRLGYYLSRQQLFGIL